MTILREEAVDIRSSEAVVIARQAVREWAVQLGFSLVDQTKIVTAASEIARNTLVHGGGGQLLLQQVNDGNRSGLQLVFEDHGPGIKDVEQAMRDGFTTGAGLGLGLGGARRLSSEFEITSTPGAGTRVRILRWRP
ncbi:MAG TPA: anti-sigma regulatory factor [Vicinamibacterales bacterium]|nr:anti-sigma regulatory factor [Vicinamibacterales bacterium]